MHPEMKQFNISDTYCNYLLGGTPTSAFYDMNISITTGIEKQRLINNK